MILNKIFTSFLALTTMIGGLFQPVKPIQPVGASLPQTPALVSDYLATAITKTATTMTLAGGTYRDGTPLVGYMCFTLDVNSQQVEYVCGTASSTTITGLSRGISYSNPNTTSSALAYPHNRLASVTITNYPQSEFVNRKLNGTDALDTPLYYSNSSASFITSSSQLASKAYADALTFSGAPNGSTIQKGIYQEASTTNIGNGTAVGSTGADLIVPNSYFNTTSSATTTVPVTNASGKLSQGFLDLTQPFTFTGGVTSTATTSLATTNITGTATFNATTSFAQIPTTTSTSPTTSTQLTTKGYTDLTYPSFISSSSISAVINTGTISSISTTSTVPTNARYGVLTITLTTVDSGATNYNNSYTFEVLRQGNTSMSAAWSNSSNTHIQGTVSAGIAGNVMTVSGSGPTVSNTTHSYTLSGTIYWF